MVLRQEFKIGPLLCSVGRRCSLPKGPNYPDITYVAVFYLLGIVIMVRGRDLVLGYLDPRGFALERQVINLV